MLAEGSDGRPVMVWNTSAFQLLIISATGGFTGLFVYAPVPGAGNLIDSIAPAAGTDPYGNTYVQGIASYAAGNSAVNSQLTAGTLRFNEPAIFSAASIGSNASAALILGSGQVLNTDNSAIIALGPGAVGTVATVAILNSALELEEQNTPAADGSVTAGPKLFGNFSGSLQVVEDSRSGDGQLYSTEHIRLVGTGGPQTVNSTADAPVTGLTRSVGKGSYHFHAKIEWTQGGTASNQKFGFTGPAASSASETLQSINTSSQQVPDGRHNSGLATVAIGSAIYAAGSVVITEIDGLATFTAAGTLSVGVACTVAANTFTVTNTESWLDVDPM